MSRTGDAAFGRGSGEEVRKLLKKSKEVHASVKVGKELSELFDDLLMCEPFRVHMALILNLRLEEMTLTFWTKCVLPKASACVTF